MRQKSKWQEQIEEKIERVLAPKEPSVQPPKVEVREPDFLWSGRPVYRCRECGDKYERVENLVSVLKHEEERHGLLPRPSSILGADGKPLTVLEA